MPQRMSDVIRELEDLANLADDPEVRTRLQKALKALTDLKTPSTSQAPADYLLPVELARRSGPPSDDSI